VDISPVFLQWVKTNFIFFLKNKVAHLIFESNQHKCRDACSSRLPKTAHTIDTKSSSTFPEYSDGNWYT